MIQKKLMQCKVHLDTENNVTRSVAINRKTVYRVLNKRLAMQQRKQFSGIYSRQRCQIRSRQDFKLETK